MAETPFGHVPRPEATGGVSGVASNVTAQMSSWMSSVKDAGTMAFNKVKDNQQIQALHSTASKFSENVSGAVRSSPLGTVSQQAESMKTLITGQQKEPETVSEYVDEAMTLSYKKRLIGFGICLLSGIFFTFLSTLMLPLIVIKPHKFAVAYSLGNLLMMLSTIFLVGPKKQCQNMWTGHRAMASIAYFGSMVGTIYAAMGLRIYILVIIFVGIQFAALIWYSLSYIPFGRYMLCLSFDQATVML
ncbi:hypothetical protein GUITHDRAFT_112211 [Guillardia theta CCMP2712]|uniref:Vesicle transport protein n=1 Tax=Guillardia theta (strain CCMP2712) TaxID=905079 RepID=L1J0I0_GUITC|nr:hypothetical protein GUITHDRAFT_112211 [Guillardia theta CCMP2712]EKX41792.1 hypothetical protein GUITHDRAFT_112211 [Guillardia theta CCMP2712]|eukprot:XP_005828772.1 hypothetical protein GUITHDRAFT_112211 [Guillardia theta CCMP2712]